jgi:polyhydroxybutyrate depolymerase
VPTATRAGEAADAAVAPRPSAGCARDAVETGDRLARTLEVDGQRRAYILDVPARVKPHEPAPLLLDFHGFGHSAAGVWRVSAFRELGAREGFITAYPNGERVRFEHEGREYDGPGWDVRTIDSNADLAFVRALLDHLEKTYCIDRARIFATGFSNGAFLSHVLGCTIADRFAAIAPVSGGAIRVGCRPSRAVPVLIQHGTQDELIGVAAARAARDSWIEVNGCRERASGTCERWDQCRDGAVVEYCEEEFAHRWPPQATLRIWEFFRAHPLPAK